MREIISLEQVEMMETEEIEARMAEICEKYCEYIPGRFVPKSEVLAFIVPAISDFTKLSESEDLPPFTLELVLAFLKDSADKFTSGKIEEKYDIKFYDLLESVAKNKTATVEVLETIINELEYLSNEGLEVDLTKYMIAVAIVKHEICTSEMLDAIIDFGLYCRNCICCFESDESIMALVIENPKTPIETLYRVREGQIEKFGEQPRTADDDEEIDLCNETIVDAIDRVLSARAIELKQLENQAFYNNPDQYKLF